MKCTILHSNLQQGLKIVQKVIPSKPQLPILSSLLLKVSSSSVTVAGTDLYFGASIEIPASVTDEGACAIPGKVFTEAVFALQGGKLTFELQDSSLQIRSDLGASFSIPIQPHEEYPEFPAQEGLVQVLSVEDLQMINEKVSYAAATDQARLTLTTIFLEQKEGKTRAVATDGFRLAILDVPHLNQSELNVLIPARALQEVTRFAEQTKEKTVDCSFSDSLKQVFFRVGAAQFYSRLVEGDFPPYQKIVPDAFETEILIDTEQFRQTLKQATIFARDISNIVQFSIHTELAQLEVSARGVSGSYKSEIPIELLTYSKEKDNTIAFNVKYVLDFLQKNTAQQTYFAMNEPLKPAVFKQAKQDQLQYIVMPFRLNE